MMQFDEVREETEISWRREKDVLKRLEIVTIKKSYLKKE